MDAADPSTSTSAGDQTSRIVSRRVEVDGRTWTLVDLEDGLSWDLYAGDAVDLRRVPRLAHITVSERGYFSTDVPGVVRGPYTTLDEAAYPIALGDPVLLDDPGDRTQVSPPVPVRSADSRPPRRSRSRAAARTVVLLLAAIGALTLALRFVGGARAGSRFGGTVEIVQPGRFSFRASRVDVAPSAARRPAGPTRTR